MNNFLFYIGCAMIFCALAAAILLRWYFVTYTGRLVRCIEHMIAGEDHIEIGEDEELLPAKVEVKLRQLYEILKKQKEQNQKDKETLEHIISDISHQVKTPITNIRLYQGLLNRDDLPLERRVEFLQLMENQVDRLDVLMESMIQMSRMEVGIVQLKPVLQKLAPLIEESVGQFALRAEEKQIRIGVECSPQMKAVFDKKWTAEALGNILDNGIKYTQPGGSITITADTTDFFVKICVSDTGKGIPEEHYTKIFKRFYREEEVQQQEGIGIGLFLAQEIVRQQNGYIDVKSKPGKGSAFSIYLPAES